MTLAAVWAKHRYSASVDERATVDCFLEDQEIGLGPRKTQNPLVERQSCGEPAQFASQYAWREIGLDRKVSLYCKVLLRKLSTHLTATMWASVGACMN